MPPLSMTSPNTRTLPDPNTSEGRPVERGPIDSEPQVALALRREAANRRTVKGKIIPALDEKLFVVIQHVQAAFEITEEHGHGLDPLFVGQILEPFFLDLADRERGSCAAPLPPDSVFEFIVSECQEITQFVGHGYPSVSYSIQQDDFGRYTDTSS